jgi:hypothetical protein
MGVEPEEPQQPKRVFFDTRAGIADEAHAALARVLDAADRVVERTVSVKSRRAASATQSSVKATLA